VTGAAPVPALDFLSDARMFRGATLRFWWSESWSLLGEAECDCDTRFVVDFETISHFGSPALDSHACTPISISSTLDAKLVKLDGVGGSISVFIPGSSSTVRFEDLEGSLETSKNCLLGEMEGAVLERCKRRDWRFEIRAGVGLERPGCGNREREMGDLGIEGEVARLCGFMCDDSSST